jgi:hypothetical protein
MRDPTESVNPRQRPSDRIEDVIWVLKRLSPNRSDPEQFYNAKDWAIKSLLVLLHSGDVG